MSRYIVFAHIIITILRYHSLQDIWKCASISEVFENYRQGFSNRLTAELNQLIHLS